MPTYSDTSLTTVRQPQLPLSYYYPYLKHEYFSRITLSIVPAFGVVEVTICLATPNGWETSQRVRLHCLHMAIIWSDNNTWHRHSFVRHASSVDYCQSSTTDLACASLLRVKPQYIILSIMPNGFARGLCPLLSMSEGLLSTQPCTSARRPLPSSSSKKSARVGASR